MARAGKNILDTGDKFPNLKLQTLDGSVIETPTGLKNPWNVILFYRGFWCPFCKTQLKSFQNGLGTLSEEGIGVLAVSVDPLDKAKETQKETGAAFPIAYGVPVKETAEAIGAFTSSPDSCSSLPSLNRIRLGAGWKNRGCSL